MSYRTVNRTINKLEKYGYVEVVGKHFEDGSGRPRRIIKFNIQYTNLHIKVVKGKDRLNISLMFNLSFFNLKIKEMYKRRKILKIPCINIKYIIYHMYIKNS